MISWGRGISLGCRCIRLGLRIDWDTLVGNISNITIVVVSSVLDILGTAIRKSNSVRSRNNTISIRGFSSVESSLGVIISNSILVSVRLRGSLLLNIRGRLVGRGRGMVGRGSLHNRGVVGRGDFHDRGVVSWGSNNWGVVSWSYLDRGLVSWGSNNWSIVSWGSNNWSMVSGSNLDNRGSMVDWGRGSMVNWSWSISCLHWESSWSNCSSSRLLIASIAMYRLRSSMGLAHNRSMYSSMGLVNRVGDSRSIALLDALVVGLVSGYNSQEGSTDKSLHVSVLPSWLL